ncbi:MAG: competence/damage-inducible protein A [Rhodospirillales bacterium]|nr:competence/damage-inducible protein A [Rhodospirillales bacterium]
MPNLKIVTACVIIIGNEVLSGRTRDANLPFLATRLNDLGIRLREARVVADDTAAIVAAVNATRAYHDYVFTTGGIGPTHDDITAASIAAAFGAPLWRDPEAVAYLQQQYAPGDLNEARLRMADVPKGAHLIENPVSRAPGFRMDNVFVLPGVPRIMQAMFDGLAHCLVGGAPMLSRTIAAFTLEGAVADPLSRIQQQHPSVDMGSYPFVRDGRIGTSLVLRATEEPALNDAADAVKTMIRDLGVEPMDE